MFLTGIQIRDYSTTLQTGTDKTMLLKNGTLQGLNGVSAITLTATDDQKTKILQKTEETGGKTTASPFCLLAPAGGVEYLSFLSDYAYRRTGTDLPYAANKLCGKPLDSRKTSGDYDHTGWYGGNHHRYQGVSVG